MVSRPHLDAAPMLNDGLVLLHPSPPQEERTIIVSGLARSGTSMVAGMLHEAGLFVGDEIDSVVCEDREIGRTIGGTGLAAVIAARNSRHRVWGFKRPNLHVHGPRLISAFRNPWVVVTSRDPVTIGRRVTLSEHLRDELACIQTAATDTLALIAFAAALACPVLLISYEKALQDALGVTEALLAFCALEGDARAIAKTVMPNRIEYLQSTERQFIGHIDGVSGGVVQGWAAESGSPDPVSVELLVGDDVRATTVADGFRADLAQNGIGAGCHAFGIAIPGTTGRYERLSVRIEGRTWRLVGSGKRMNDWL